MDRSSIIQSLPNRPIFRQEIEEMKAKEDVDALLPIYAGMIDPAAVGTNQIHGFVLGVHNTVYAFVFDGGEKQWETLWQTSTESKSLDSAMQTGFEKLRTEWNLTTGIIQSDHPDNPD